jgi:hypothetical protein
MELFVALAGINQVTSLAGSTRAAREFPLAVILGAATRKL